MERLIELKLENFQAHGSLTISFSPTITTIKGPSDVGKSAILRALGWVCLNNITGDGFIKEGEKETTVTLTVAGPKDPVKIVRCRGRYDNVYELNEEEYKSFGQGSVPEDIAGLLRLNNINFQNQHDSPFWFAESAPEVSRQMNTVIDLGIIDTSLSNIATEVRRAQEKVVFVTERITEAKAELEKIEPQRARVEEFKQLKEEHGRFTATKESTDQLASIITRVRESRDQQRALEEKAVEGRGVLETFREVLDLAEKSAELVDLVRDIGRHQAVEAPPDFTSVEEAEELVSETTTSWEDLNNLLKKIRQATGNVEFKEGVMRTAEKKFHEQIKGKDCPLCQRPLP